MSVKQAALLEHSADVWNYKTFHMQTKRMWSENEQLEL